MRKKLNQAGFASRELLPNIFLLYVLLIVLMPVIKGIQVGIRNGYSTFELLGTIIIGFMIGLIPIIGIVFILWTLSCLCGFFVIRPKRLKIQKQMKEEKPPVTGSAANQPA